MITVTQKGSKDIIGLVKNTSGKSMATKNSPICAIAVCPYQGFKRAYHVSVTDAIEWIYRSVSNVAVNHVAKKNVINGVFYEITVISLSKVETEMIDDLVAEIFPARRGAIEPDKIVRTLFEMLKQRSYGIISVQIQDSTGLKTVYNME